MVFDERGDEEPDDPEFDVRDGEELIPSPPTVGEETTNESAPGNDPTAVGDSAPPAVKKTFWAVVLLIDIALAGLVLGPVIVYFTGDLQLGGGIFLIGLFCGASAYRRYRAFQATPDEELGIASASESQHSDTDSSSSNDPE